jgi:hypothetical protein
MFHKIPGTFLVLKTTYVYAWPHVVSEIKHHFDEEEIYCIAARSTVEPRMHWIPDERRK